MYEIEPGILGITGGKLTTYRRMAADAVDRIAGDLGNQSRCRTKWIRLGSSDPERLRVAVDRRARKLDVPSEVVTDLIRRYGDRSLEVLDVGAAEDLLSPLVPGETPVAAEARLLRTREEMAMHLDDLLSRRTRLSLHRPGGRDRDRLAGRRIDGRRARLDEGGAGPGGRVPSDDDRERTWSAPSARRHTDRSRSPVQRCGGRVSSSDSYEMVRSFDGSMIATRRLSNTEEGTPLLIVERSGGRRSPRGARSSSIVARDRRIFTWDHRGLLDSGPPNSDHLDPGAQAEDAAAVLDHFGHERCLIAVLEQRGAHRSRVRVPLSREGRRHWSSSAVAMATLLCGSPAISRSHLCFPIVTGIAKHFAGYLEGPFKAFVGRPEITGFIRQSGLVGANADTSGLIELLHELTRSDLKRLLASFEAVVGDADPDLLAGIQAPTLLVAGEKDQFAPMRIQHEMAADIPNVELKVYERATHYLPLEFPAKLSDDMRRFFKDWT